MMQRFEERLVSTAIPLLENDIDTDIIIPQHALITVSKGGLGKGLFANWRYREDGSLNQDFIFNKEDYKTSEIIFSGDNFGCGSSREHAVWALLDSNIKCVISTSFGPIFYKNSILNGLLPLIVNKSDWLVLKEESLKFTTLEIDLVKEKVVYQSGECSKEVHFHINEFDKKFLLGGKDLVDITLDYSSEIDSYESA
ncbi:3-isopropylmalate dehydratase small subunit [Pseudoalteromonas sp. S16_S37]|uniref:3-isopropylmalate dehydratase small subunit n=1 Tax=Pseudoalteromonas sp. S16_S37 TaxID=2720228 RepID=UPI00168134DF|nr:3-isopropylmalate dehydratase small subunit [Pseudoalteromonas sp. S16_S37]MBD1583640.1 3-isopropylmalate dehydratase small subunit [Pseudoalteromonas sp. S16_S37]